MPWADLTDARLYYELNGQGEVVLLVPGLGATCEMWSPVVPELSERYLTLAIDNRGVGRSQPKRTPLTLSHFAADLAELLDYLQLERVHVIGTSLGGVIAQCLAVEQPHRVERLVLLSCAHRFSPYLSEMARFMWHALTRFSRRQYIRSMELFCVGPRHLDSSPGDFERQIEEGYRRMSPRVALARQLKALRDSAFDPRDYAIHCPTMVLSGECDRLIPACYARDMALEIRNCQTAIIPDAGHPLIQECPQEVLSRVIPFLSGAASLETPLRRRKQVIRPVEDVSSNGERLVAVS